jgi:predicted porin
VGLGGGWGDVRFGRQSVWWSNGVIAQTGANYINTAVDGLINDPGLLAIPSARQSSVVSYNSPTFGGFNASLSYSPQTQETATTFGAGADEGSLWGITGRYTSGAIRAQADWARNGSVGNVDGADNTGWKVGLGWAYAPGSQLSGIYGRLENEVPGLELKQNFWLLNWEHMLGQIQLLAQFYKSDDVDGSLGEIADSGATGVTLAAKYFLSKRTGVYASFSTVRNDDLSFADMSGGGMSSGGAGGIPATSAGADVKLFAVGIMHNF